MSAYKQDRLIATLRAERDEWKEKAEKTREAFAKMTYEALGATRDFAIAANERDKARADYESQEANHLSLLFQADEARVERDAANARAEALLLALERIAAPLPNEKAIKESKVQVCELLYGCVLIARDAIAAAREARG